MVDDLVLNARLSETLFFECQDGCLEWFGIFKKLNLWGDQDGLYKFVCRYLVAMP